MNYKSFNKFITEKSAQAAAKDWEKFGNRASRSMAKLNQKCGQLTGDAKTSCLYGQTDDNEKNESYIVEQEARALGGENSRKLKELEAAYSATGRGKTVASGPYAGKMRGELRAMISALKSGDKQKAKDIETIGSSGIGGGLQRDQEGNVRVDQATAKRQGDKYMSDVAKSQGGEFNPETGQIELGAKIPLVSTGNFFSVGKDGNMQTNYGNIAQTAAQAGLMAIPGGAAVGALGRGGAAAIRGVQGVRGARNITKAQKIAANAKRARDAGASRATVQGMQQAGRQTMQQGMRQTAQATRGQAVGQGRAALTGAANTVRGAATGARLGSAPVRAAATGVRNLAGGATRALTGRAAGSAVGAGGRLGAATIGAGSRLGAATIGAAGRVASTAIRNPIKTAALGVGADVAFNDGRITKDLVNRGSEALGGGPVFSTQADKPKEDKKTEPKVDPQAGPEVKPATDTATTDATTTTAATGSTTQKPEPKPDTGAAAATVPATGTAVAAASKFVPEKIPDGATPEQRQEIAQRNLEGSQRARNMRDFGTETPTETQIQKRSEASRSKTAARRASRDEIMSDSSSPAMKKAQAEIDKKNKSRKARGLPPLNDPVMDRIKAREANKAVSAAGAGAAAGGASEPSSSGAFSYNTRDITEPKPATGDTTGETPKSIGGAAATAAAGLGNLAIGDFGKAADRGDELNRYLRQSGRLGNFISNLSSRIMGTPTTEYIPPEQRRQLTPGAGGDPQAGPAARSGPTRQQVETDPRFAQIKGALAGERQTDADRGDVGAGSAAIKPGEDASAARLRIDKELREKGLSQDKITAEMIRLGLRRPAPGSGGGNVSRTVDQSRTSGPTTPMQ